MSNQRFVPPVVAGLLLLVPALSLAGVRPWISGSVGGSTYSMEDVNDEIGAINSVLAGSGLEMDEVTKGFNFGLAFGLDLANGFAVGAGFDRLSGGSEVGDYSGSLEYDLPANLLRVFGRYTFESAGNAKGFLEASLGRVSSAGSIRVSATGYGSATGDIDGSGLAFEGAGGVSLWASPQVAFTGMIGFRKATAGDVEVDGQPIYDPSGGDYTLDYSGVFVRAGLMVALGP